MVTVTTEVAQEMLVTLKESLTAGLALVWKLSQALMMFLGVSLFFSATVLLGLATPSRLRWSLVATIASLRVLVVAVVSAAVWSPVPEEPLVAVTPLLVPKFVVVTLLLPIP